MKIEFWLTGKSNPMLAPAEAVYEQRIRKYVPFEQKLIAEKVKSGDTESLKRAEGKIQLEKLDKSDYLILLDDKGKSYNSKGFSQQLNNYMISGKQRIVFLVGGAYGFSDDVYSRANEKLSLSQMTFSHQVIRLIFLEQLYRAFTILNNEPYHHE